MWRHSDACQEHFEREDNLVRMNSELPPAKYEHLSKTELVNLLRRRDASRKLGLVWERDELEHERAVNDDFVTVDLVPELSVGYGPYRNLLIEGDNFDALRHLRIAYKGRIKCIYIDPPYNTGSKDFIYNDSYVGKDDTFKHSKWLEFMYQRLILARDLLANDGAIFISIDEAESAHLTLLMEQVFPERRVANFVWKRRSGANLSKDRFLSVDHEYVLCYANPGFTFAGNTKALQDYANPDNDERGPWVSSDLGKAHTWKQRPDAFYPLLNPETGVWYPVDPERVWAFATAERAEERTLRTKTMEQLISERRVLWPEVEETITYSTVEELMEAVASDTVPANLSFYKHLDQLEQQIASGEAPAKLLNYIEPLEKWVGRKIGLGKPRYKRFASELRSTEKPVSTWIKPVAMKASEARELELDGATTLTSGYTSEGTKILSQIMGNKDFDYPKPLSLIKELVHQSTSATGNDIVLDFFAGSGTTGHAVLSLNEDDGGNRTFIMVSSTEATEAEAEKNICRDVTARRMKKVIEGYSYRGKSSNVQVDGLQGEFAYLRTERIAHESLLTSLRHDQVWLALQEIHAGAVSAFDPSLVVQSFTGDAFAYDILYIPKLSEEALTVLTTRLKESAKPCVVYSWQPGLISQRCTYEHLKLERIPEALIERFGKAL